MSRGIENVQVIDQWCLNNTGHLYGKLVGQREIRTSAVVERDGDVVTTKSGSRYRLGSPHAVIADSKLRKEHYEDASTAYAVIDSYIEESRD